MRRMRIAPAPNHPQAPLRGGPLSVQTNCLAGGSGAASPNSPISTASPLSPSDSKRPRRVLGVLPKRISLPENLEFQPQMLLNLKQSIHVEKQLGAAGNPETTGVHQPVDPTTKQLLKARMLQQQQKRLNKTRLQLLRQQVGIPTAASCCVFYTGPSPPRGLVS